MKYNNLHELIGKSMSSRRYFLSLPVEKQMRLHECDELIHSAAELHSFADIIVKYDRSVKISESLDRYFG